MIKRTRLSPQARKDQILVAALTLAKKKGYAQFTLAELARKLKISRSTVNHYFIDRANLQSEVICESIKQKIWAVIAETVTRNHPLAKTISPKMRAELKKWI